MSVIGLEIHSRRPFAGGAPFGRAGSYERLDGTLHFAVDPTDPANEGIVDLDRAERDPDGRVHFRADLCLVQPVDPAGANRRLLLEVPNRGRKGTLGRFNRPAQGGAPVDEEMELGDGLLLSLGWTVAWCGWQWDVIRDLTPAGLMALDAPQAIDETGRPIAGQVMLQWQLDAPAADKLLADRVHQPYPAATLDEPEAVLCVRAWPGAPRREIPRDRWRFARDVGGVPVPDETHVWLAGGFQSGEIYELTYTTRHCPVVGTGLLAIRDGVAFLRYSPDASPCAGRIDHVFGIGSSQCGRFLRHFLSLGLNVDPTGRQVFDGLLINVAGARRGEFNHRYAQPSVITIPSFGHLPPFAFDEQTDPITGQSDGLLRRQRARGGVPRIFVTNTSAEYWNREASLLHTDIAGTVDVEPPDDVRLYHFAGTKHGPGELWSVEETKDGVAGENGRAGGGLRSNVVDFRPLLRAALFNLEQWVTADKAPPPNAVPRLAAGTAATPEAVLAAYRAIPGVVPPDPDRLYRRRRLDLGPEAARGIGTYPAREGEPYRWYLPAVDADGNEVAGIALPDVAVPVATHTGWFTRRPGTGGAGQNTDMAGATIPFPPDARRRAQTGDPRPAITERYRDRADYLARARAVALDLAAAGYLLPEDVDLVVENAVRRYDAFAPRAPELAEPAAEGAGR